MKLPIYQSDSHNELPPMTQANKGLRFERFFNEYQLTETNIKPKDDAKKEFLKKFTETPCGNSQAIEQATLRQLALAKSQNGDGKIYQLDGNFVTGMGNSHPVENGFSWHYTLGTPYLSGSMVKGLVRALIEQYYQGEDKTDVIYQWFGSEDRTVDKSDNKDAQKNTRDSQAGELIFFDAIPTSAPTLGVDIMTPHMKDWYAKGSEVCDVNSDSDKIPADWHDPTPIPFLAVKKAEFLFSIGKRPNSNVDIDAVFECLDNALTYLGAGAKTQTGYGYMSFDEKATNDLRERLAEQKQAEKAAADLQKAKSQASELEQSLLDVINTHDWDTDKPEAKTHLTGEIQVWLEKLEENADDTACIQRFYDVVYLHYKDLLDNPDKSKFKKKKNQVAWAKRLLALLE